MERHKRLAALFSLADKERSDDFREVEMNSWSRLETRIRREENGPRVPMWARRITVPLPLAAGVLCAVVLLVAVLVHIQGRLLPEDGPAVIAQQTGTDAQRSYPYEDASLEELEKLVRFFSEQGATIEVTIP